MSQRNVVLAKERSFTSNSNLCTVHVSGMGITGRLCSGKKKRKDVEEEGNLGMESGEDKEEEKEKEAVSPSVLSTVSLRKLQ